jgi:hypothetical protein
MGTNKMSCNISCGPDDWYPGGKCDLHGCYAHKKRCVNCQSPLDNPSTDVIETGSTDRPMPGNFTICFVCGQPYVYVENVADQENPLRKPLTKNEFRALPLIMQRVVRDAWDFRKNILDRIMQNMKGAGDL